MEAGNFKRVKKRNISKKIGASNQNLPKLNTEPVKVDIKSPCRERVLRAAAVYFDTPIKDLIEAPQIEFLHNHNPELKPTM